MQYAGQPHRVFPFRWIFPLGQLVLCLLLVSILEQMQGYLPYVVANYVMQIVTALNLPGVLIQAPVILLRANHEIWRPPGISVQLWRGILYPVLGMVFWWIAGRAVEALVAINYRQIMPKIGWVETVTGSLVMAAGATMFGGMMFGLSPSERDWQSTRWAAAGGLWVLLGALSVIARFRQWRFKKKQKATL